MHTLEIRFSESRPVDAEERSHAVGSLFGCLRQTGQILNSEFPTIREAKGCRVFVLAPEANSLSSEHHNKYVQQAFNRIAALGIEIEIFDRGHDPESEKICSCERPNWLVLFTTFISIEPPLRCGDCFGVLPLYRLATVDGEHYDLNRWQSAYRACDDLQMGSDTGERFATREMAHPESRLSKRGREVCARYSEIAGVPIYYHLFRGRARSLTSERRRPCPLCKGPWLLEAPHFLFDMKCDSCRLLSNVGWNVRR